MRISSIIRAVEQFANPSLQESWDNTGLQLGSALDECTGVLVCLDPTPAVVEEAAQKGCNLIVTHHPLFFKPVKRLTGSTSVEITAMNAIAAGISIYSTHTASDSALGGVSYALAQALDIRPERTLDPAKGTMTHLTAIVPADYAEAVQYALFDAGAGAVGKYDCCSFSVSGTGTFRPLEGAKPAIGEVGLHTTQAEVALNMVLPSELMGRVESALLDVHPYETPAYQFTPMLNRDNRLGLGLYGIANTALAPADFVEHVKHALGCAAVRTSKIDFPDGTLISRVAMCGGAGRDYISAAIAMGAQAYVSADLSYHDFVDYRDRILLIDAGHYNTEAPIKHVLRDAISAKFPDLQIFCTTTDENPINYV